MHFAKLSLFLFFYFITVGCSAEKGTAEGSSTESSKLVPLHSAGTRSQGIVQFLPSHGNSILAVERSAPHSGEGATLLTLFTSEDRHFKNAFVRPLFQGDHLSSLLALGEDRYQLASFKLWLSRVGEIQARGRALALRISQDSVAIESYKNLEFNLDISLYDGNERLDPELARKKRLELGNRLITQLAPSPEPISGVFKTSGDNFGLYVRSLVGSAIYWPELSQNWPMGSTPWNGKVPAQPVVCTSDGPDTYFVATGQIPELNRIKFLDSFNDPEFIKNREFIFVGKIVAGDLAIHKVVAAIGRETRVALACHSIGKKVYAVGSYQSAVRPAPQAWAAAIEESGDTQTRFSVFENARATALFVSEKTGEVVIGGSFEDETKKGEWQGFAVVTDLKLHETKREVFKGEASTRVKAVLLTGQDQDRLLWVGGSTNGAFTSENSKDAVPFVQARPVISPN